MAIEIVDASNTPNEGRVIWNDGLIDLDGRINEVELGIDAFSTTSASFVQPAVSATVSVTVDETGWMAVGQPVYMTTGGTYTVSSVTDTTNVVLTNLGYSGNAAPAATVASGKKVSPSGFGDTGAATDLDGLSDVAISSPATRDVVRYNGTTWENEALDAADTQSGTFTTARIGTGTPASGKYVDGAAGAWTTLPSGGHTIQDESTPLTSRANLNFTGAGVAATDDSGNNQTDVTIPGKHIVQDEGSSQTARTNLDFQGTGVTVTDNSGSDKTIVTIPSGGTPGADGIDAFSTTNGSFTQPAVNSTVSVNLDTTDTATPTAWMGADQYVYVVGGGYYQVDSITDGDTVVLENLGYTGNAAPAATVSSAAKVSPGGIRGATGATGGGATDLDSLTDVVISSPSDDQYLRHNGTNWVNETVSGGSGYRTLLTVASDVTITGTSFADVTGLTFSVTSGTNYRFQAVIPYDASATTVGASAAVNGPASPTILSYYIFLNAASGSPVHFQNNIYDDASRLQTASRATNNLCLIQGMIRPSASGTFAIRFATEATGTITVKAGSTLEWW